MKNSTMKSRIAFLCLLIMMFTVFSIMLTEFILQKRANTIKFDMGEINKIEEKKEGNLDRILIIEETKRQFEKQQQEKFIWLVVTSITILTIGMSIIYFIIKREVQPLESLKKDMDKMDFHDENSKLLTSKSNTAEIVSLTNSYNIMITKLKESYEAQKRFNQNAAHELRTPITTMKTSLQVNKMLNKNLDDQTTELLFVLESQVTRMENLVSGLLLINSKEEIKKKKINVRLAIEEIILCFQSQIEEKNIAVSIKGEKTLKTDEKVFNIVLKNLIENAIKYNNKNGLIKIDLTNNIIIKDTGIGIALEEQDKIFSPFYCIDQSRSREFGGVGLGLAILRDGINKLGFEIQIDSKLGEGSTFTIITDK